ncbi:uncharacterized protein DS421_16g537760 [Arachis hypogaea]|nr:uncharacterized protein DS421_16g537760 [Arachis hypogaea]
MFCHRETRRCWGLTAAVPAVAGVAPENHHRGEVGGDGGGCWCWLAPSLQLAIRAAPPSLPPENVAQSPENSVVDPPELLAATEAVAGAGSKSQLLRVVIPSCYSYCESGWELRFWLPSVRVEAERTLRRLDYGICVLR